MVVLLYIPVSDESQVLSTSMPKQSFSEFAKLNMIFVNTVRKSFPQMLHRVSPLYSGIYCYRVVFGLNDPLRQYFSPYRVISQREGERKGER